MPVVKDKRGATFIIVLALLSILVLIATTISFSSKMEIISAANFSEGVQARQLALSGFIAAIESLQQPHFYTSFEQSWAKIGREFIPGLTVAETDSKGTFISLFPSHLAKVRVYDQSGKININTASEAQLASGLRYILADHSLSSAQAETLAKSIITYRLGPDGKPGKANFDDDFDNSQRFLPSRTPTLNIPQQLYLQAIAINVDGLDNDQDGETDEPDEGLDADGLDNDYDGQIDEPDEGIDEPDEFQADLRLPPRGDDRPFISLGQLRLLPKFQDDKLFNAISPHLTVFSSSREVYAQDGEILNKININLNSPVTIYDNLKRYLPGKDETLLKQFAVNIVDFRDRDNVPTVFPQAEQSYPILGVENTPYINEVWPDSVTEDQDGDDGQYIELFNPYKRSISVNGWHISVGPSTVYLTDSIAPQGFLIITDDYNNENDPEPEDEFPNYGSLYDIFKVLPNESERRLIEHVGLNIPDDNGTVYLYDDEGHLIDYFRYTGGRYAGVNRSFQRSDPRVRLVEKTYCTPLALNANHNPTDDQLNKLKTGVANRLFASPAEVMKLSAGFANRAGTVGQGWTWPTIALNSEADSLDSRIIDVFTIINNMPPQLTKSRPENISPNLADRVARFLDKFEKSITFGRLNINTASYPALLAVPEMPEEIAKAIIDYRSSPTNQETSEAMGTFRTLSEMLRCPAIWGSLSEQARLYLFERWINYLTVNSYAFWCNSRGVVSEQGRIQHQVALEALLGLEGGDRKLVYFRFLN